MGQIKEIGPSLKGDLDNFLDLFRIKIRGQYGF